MRALLQRVSEARVRVAGAVIGEIGPGLLILVCAMRGDTRATVERLAAKIVKLRIFKDEEGKINRSLLDAGGHSLVVSQFTLAADVSRGNRPGFSAAAPPAEGERLYELFAASLHDHGITTEQGQFAADMKVELVNDGPVTIWMDTDA